MSDGRNGDALAGLEAVHRETRLRAELIGAVVQARRNLQDQKEIASETVARFTRRVQRAERDAFLAGIDLTTVPAE
jgi:hypothetical protein